MKFVLPQPSNDSGQDSHEVTPEDSVNDHWVDRVLPEAMIPYARLARLDRPIGTWLLVWPCLWSVAMASAAIAIEPDWWLMVLFAIGALVMRGAGCTFNDIVDRDLDGKVARTAGRPLPSGQVSLTQAWVFLVAQSLIGLIILLQFNPMTIGLGIGSLGLVAIYPFMKRFTYWPQVFLGLAFNWGALMGWSAVTGGLTFSPVQLYLAGIAWTLGYDTIYALQDKEDDALIGIKSTALRFGATSARWIGGFYVLFVLLAGAAFFSSGMNWPAFAGLGLAALHLAWQVIRLEIDERDRCLDMFRSNRDTGAFIFCGLVLTGFLAMSA